MNTATINTCPALISEILNELNSLEDPTDWGHVYDKYADKDLTQAICYESAFVVLLNNEIFLFDSDEQECTWSVLHVGQPVINVDPNKYTDPQEVAELIEELRYEFPKTEIRLSGDQNDFMKIFGHRINGVIESVRRHLR